MPKILTLFDNKGFSRTGHDILTTKVVRWTVDRKRLIAMAIKKEMVTMEQVIEAHGIEVDELTAWIKALEGDAKALQVLGGFKIRHNIVRK